MHIIMGMCILCGNGIWSDFFTDCIWNMKANKMTMANQDHHYMQILFKRVTINQSEKSC